eukprot:7390703-Prymnesium_polylepis.1
MAALRSNVPSKRQRRSGQRLAAQRTACALDTFWAVVHVAEAAIAHVGLALGAELAGTFRTHFCARQAEAQVVFLCVALQLSSPCRVSFAVVA